MARSPAPIRRAAFRNAEPDCVGNGMLKGLGYVGVQTAALEDWRRFGVELLGLQLAERTPESLTFRMDAVARRLFVREGEAEGGEFYGWEVDDAAALETIGARLQAHGFAVSALPRDVCEQRGVAEAIVSIDPAGHRLELFHGQRIADTAFIPGRPISGFRTGELGMGHLALNVARVEDLLPYYRDALGFRLSDYALRPFKGYFFHCNARHHSLALIENRQRGIHHLMVEVGELDDLGQGYDLAQLEPGRVATTLGRHSNDHMTSFYVRSPSGFLVEYGWGGRSIDPEHWQANELSMGPSLWGHDRDWLPAEIMQEARRLRMAAAASGIRAPLAIETGAGPMPSRHQSRRP
jgi:2,3-dihydroxybiphenyl 1,2-dioxygenase